MPTAFYRLQMKAGTEGRTIANEVLAQHRITSNAEYAGEQFEHLTPGSVIMVHKGAYPVALVRVLSRIPEEQQLEPSFGIDYRVEIISSFDEARNEFPNLEELHGSIPYQGTFRKVDMGNATYERIHRWFTSVTNKRRMQSAIDLLKFKGQIILQGPPGTGKTRLARIIAEELTKPKNLGSPIAEITRFFTSFDASRAEVQQRREQAKTLLDEFQSRFPKENLRQLDLDSYPIGKGTNDSFCWWMEIGLESLGYYFPGNAKSYLLYWHKANSEFSKHGALKGVTDDAEAMRRLAEALAAFIETRDFKTASKIFGDSFLLKLLHSYFPDQYAPINSVACMDNALKLLGISKAKRSPLEKNLEIQRFFTEAKAHHSADVTNQEFIQFLFDRFDLRGDIQLEEAGVVAKGESKIVQFHPAYSYEDFVRGISAKTDNEGRVFYEVENRILAEFAEKALSTPSANFVLIVDEINRANLPAVLGELIYALEYRHDEAAPEVTTVESMYAIKRTGADEQANKALKLPKNLYVIGTMNTADRSVGHIDYAIRRRFAFLDVLPSDTVLDEVIADPQVRTKAKTIFTAVASLFTSEYLAPDFRQHQVQLGHSYFLATNEDQLRLKLEHEIKPLLREYVKDGILLEAATQVVEALHV